MPIIQLPSIKLEYSIILFAWQNTESEAELLHILQWSNSIIAEKKSIYTHKKAWLEHLASRCLLQESKKILANNFLFWERDYGFSSLSHSENYSIVAYSKAKIGIDLEKIQSKALAIASKFMNAKDKEQLIQYNSIEQQYKYATINWSIKEAMFKAWQQKEVKYSQEFFIEKIDLSQIPFSTTALAQRNSLGIISHFNVYIMLLFNNFAFALVQEK